jgi:hypothetical protein
MSEVGTVGIEAGVQFGSSHCGIEILRRLQLRKEEIAWIQPVRTRIDGSVQGIHSHAPKLARQRTLKASLGHQVLSGGD